MNVLTFDDCVLKSETDKKITMKISKDGIAVKTTSGEIHTTQGDDIADAELFYGVRRMTMRVFSKEFYEICNIDPNRAEELRKAFLEFFGISLHIKEVEITNVYSGKLGVNSRQMLEFRNGGVVFDVPMRRVRSVVDIKNEISIGFEGVEVRFLSDKSTISEIKEKCSAVIEEEFLKVDDVSLLYPRGRFCVLFFKDHLKLLGRSHEHKICYKDVVSIHVLEKDYIRDGEKYVMIKTGSAVMHGQAKYEHLVMLFDGVEGEIVVEDERLEKEYFGPLVESFVSVMEALCTIKAIRSDLEKRDKMRGLKCISKAYEGQLYLLQDGLLFLPRVIVLNMRDISHVEFSRIELSSMQARTFDMSIFCGETYMFNGMQKDEFLVLEKYFSDNHIKIRSEVIEDILSSENETNDSIVEDSGE